MNTQIKAGDVVRNTKTGTQGTVEMVHRLQMMKRTIVVYRPESPEIRGVYTAPPHNLEVLDELKQGS